MSRTDPPRPAHRPPRAESTADRRLEIRCTEGERAILDDAAGADPTSAWARDVLLREAERVLLYRQLEAERPDPTHTLAGFAIDPREW